MNIYLNKYFPLIIDNQTADTSSSVPDSGTNSVTEPSMAMAQSTSQEITANVSAPNTTDEAKVGENAEAPSTFQQTLSELTSSVMDTLESAPTPEETKKYLDEIANRKRQNAQTAMLNIIDEIIELTVNGSIGEAELETEIPDSIVAKIRDGDYVTEYIQAGVTKKWAEARFQNDKGKYVISVKSQTLVEVIDTETNTFDLFGLYIQYSTSRKRNRISPEFIAKGESVCTKPRQVSSYSSFRGSQVVKKPLIPVLPTIHQQQEQQPSGPKVSTKI